MFLSSFFFERDGYSQLYRGLAKPLVMWMDNKGSSFFSDLQKGSCGCFLLFYFKFYSVNNINKSVKGVFYFF